LLKEKEAKRKGLGIKRNPNGFNAIWFSVLLNLQSIYLMALGLFFLCRLLYALELSRYKSPKKDAKK